MITNTNKCRVSKLQSSAVTDCGIHNQHWGLRGYTAPYTARYATTNDSTMNECYKEQFLSLKSGCYNERGLLSADEARACP
jgi:hypothetical protein